MVFSANPLSLSVPDAAFELWLRDSGYLEILDSRSTTATCPSSSSSSSSSSSKPPKVLTLTKAKTSTKSAFASLISFLKTLMSLLTLNPFAKLTTDDLAAPTPSWTLGFVGRLDSYSWPAGPSQARMRVQENVRRYVRNYAVLSLIFLACSLYQMPIPLLGVISSLLLWEVMKFCSDKWEMEEKHPGLRQILVRIVQFATAAILYACNLQLAFFCAISVSYTVMILHASLRKLAPLKLATGPNCRKTLQRRLREGDGCVPGGGTIEDRQAFAAKEGDGCDLGLDALEIRPADINPGASNVAAAASSASEASKGEPIN